MKRNNVLLLAAMLCLCLASCGIAHIPEETPSETTVEAVEATAAEEPQQNGPSAQRVDTAEPSEKPEQQSARSTQSTDGEEPSEEPMENVDLVGLWHLDSKKNDLQAFADSLELFPGYGEWGASMELQGDGQMSWFIGAEGWHGTYTVEDREIHAQLTSDLDLSSQFWGFRIIAENEKPVLEMDYQDMTIYWVYGGQTDLPIGSDESQDNAAYPGPEVVEIVNLRGDKTTIHKTADGTYTDSMERRYTFNGTDTWTDETGAAWNEAAKD